MPLAAMVKQSNDMLASASTIRLVKEHPEAIKDLARPGGLHDAAKKVLQVDKWGLDYLKAMPMPVQEALRAAIHGAITGDPPKPVQISYMPSYEYEVRVSDFGQAVHVQVRGPYEAVSPGAAYAKKATRKSTGSRRRVTRRVKAAKRKPARRRGR